MSQPDPPESGSAEDWMRYARSDLAVANGAREDNALPGVYCYHAQQAAEKAIKAVQVHMDLEPPYDHRIAVLLDPLRHLDLPEGVLAAVELTEYIVETRYPGALPDATNADADRAAAQALAVVEWAEAILAAR